MRLMHKDKTGYTLNEHYGMLTNGVKIAFNKLGPLEDILEKYNFDDASDLDIEIRANREKVYKYEGIEKELGIDLSILFKALKQKFVYYKGKVKIELLGLHIKSNELYLYGFVEDTTHAVYLSLKDCGKTWALTKEELL